MPKPPSPPSVTQRAYEAAVRKLLTKSDMAGLEKGVTEVHAEEEPPRRAPAKKAKKVKKGRGRVVRSPRGKH